jgi:hypothetical protein
MKRLWAIGALLVAVGVLPAATARADSNPNGTGQPSQSCQQQSASPGNASAAPGSAFNPTGTAGAVYANPGSQGGTASGNVHVVAQYDVACYQVSH